MTPRSRRGRRRPFLLIVLCLTLGALIYLELEFGLAPKPVIPAAPGRSESLALAVAESIGRMPRLSHFSEIVSRPLFAPSRRPAPPELEASEPAPKVMSLRFVLRGVVIYGAERVAIVQRKDAPEFLRLMEGQVIDGWRVEAIVPDRVIFRHEAGDLMEEVELREVFRGPGQPIR